MENKILKASLAVGLGGLAIWIIYKVTKAITVQSTTPTPVIAETPKWQVDANGNVIYTDKNIAVTLPNIFNLFSSTKQSQSAADAQQAANQILEASPSYTTSFPTLEQLFAQMTGSPLS